MRGLLLSEIQLLRTVDARRAAARKAERVGRMKLAEARRSTAPPAPAPEEPEQPGKPELEQPEPGEPEPERTVRTWASAVTQSNSGVSVCLARHPH